MHVTTKRKTTIGIDLGDRYSRVCVLDEHGEVLEEGRVMTKPEAFRQRFGGCPPCCIAIEAGTPSPWVVEVLETAGHEVWVANPRKLRMIFRNESKNDRVCREPGRIDLVIDSSGLAIFGEGEWRAVRKLVRTGAQCVDDVRATGPDLDRGAVPAPAWVAHWGQFRPKAWVPVGRAVAAHVPGRRPGLSLRRAPPGAEPAL